MKEEIWEQVKQERDDYWDKINREHSEDTKLWLSQTPEQKTERNWNCITLTRYLLRNHWRQPNPQRVEMIKERMQKWFEENNKLWCPLEVYEDLLPPKENSKVGSFQKIGGLLKI